MTKARSTAPKSTSQLAHQPSVTDAAVTSAWTIHQAFEVAAAMRAEEPAVESAGRVLTYAELHRLSDRLGAQLKAHGLASGDICAVDCRSLADFAIGTLGVMKAGGSYIALDNRASRSAGDARLPDGVARFGVTPEKTWTAGGGVTAIPNAFSEPDRQTHAQEPTAGTATFNRVAYVCFTSGTTGIPKGVMVPHAGVHGLVCDPIFSVLRADRRMASTSTFAFDAATFEVWGALLNGACVVEAPPECLRSPQVFSNFVQSRRIDGAFLTTSIFHALGTRQPEAFAGLECLVIGGEACDPVVARQVLASGQAPTRLINGYGPTETVTFATAQVLDLRDLEHLRAPIGRPISGRTAYIVDEKGEIAPFGVEGELMVGGDCVSLGYLNDPATSAAKFIADPFGGRPGGRLYRTGDICRMSADGTIDFLGRADDQVKVRGYRVELQGVAALLRQLPGVADAVVLPRKNRLGGVEPEAFLAGDQRYSPAEFRRQVASLMPDYMQPSVLHWVERIPWTATGKVDRNALLRLADVQQAAQPVASPTADPVTEELRRIWYENGVTGPFSADDDYFDVGGNSLALISVALDVESRFGVTLPPDVFGGRLTLNTLAHYLRVPKRPEEPATSVRGTRAFVMSQPWNMTRFPPEIATRICPDGRWAQLQISPTEAFASAYPDLSAMAAELVRQIQETRGPGPLVLIGHSFGGVLVFEAAHQLLAAGEQVERLILLDSFLEVRRPPVDAARVWLRQSIYALLRGDWGLLAERIGRVLRGQQMPSAAPDRLAQAILAHCLEAMNAYQPRPLDTRASIFRCRQYEVAFDRPELSSRRLLSPWDGLLRGPNETIWIDTDHAGIVRDPEAIQDIARHLSGPSAGPWGTGDGATPPELETPSP